MSPRKKRKGSPPRKIFLWERALIFSKSVYELFANWLWKAGALVSVMVTVAIEWLKDPNNQDAVKAAVPLWIFAALLILAGTIRAYPHIKEVKAADNTNREKV
jgi:hypothetical protein